MRGGSGRNGASYEDAVTGVYVDLTNPQDNSGEAANDSYAWVQDLHGSAFADVLLGDHKVNYLYGNAGNDMLNGRSGDDVLEGGAGADGLSGGSGVDTASYAGAAGGEPFIWQRLQTNRGNAFWDSAIAERKGVVLG